MRGDPPPDSARDLAAAEWIVRRQDGPLSAVEQARWAAWLAADAGNRRAHERLDALWVEIGRHEALAAIWPLRDAGQAHVAVASPKPPAARRLLRPLAAAAALAAAMVGAIMLRPAPDGPVRQFATGVGRIGTVRLADGSTVTLAPRSRIEVRFAATRRFVALRAGEAYFQIARDAARPFDVDLGTSSLRVVGTEFDVLRAPDQLRVAVVHGVVQLHDGADGGAAPLLGTLGKGQLARIERPGDARQRITVMAFDDRGMAAFAGGWRDGWLVYEGARLGDIVADLNRYFAPGIVLGDPSLAGLQVTASFRAADIPGFLGSLDRLFPVAVVREPTGGFRINPRAPEA